MNIEKHLRKREGRGRDPCLEYLPALGLLASLAAGFSSCCVALDKLLASLPGRVWHRCNPHFPEQEAGLWAQVPSATLLRLTVPF